MKYQDSRPDPNKTNKMRLLDFKLYLITDRKLFADNDSFFAAVENALKGGVRAIQLREKDLATRKLLDMAYRMRDLTAQYTARLFINDRADIALCVNADGVHTGQSGMPVYAVRKIAGERLMIGASAHSSDEAVIAEREGADFITFGPLYQTPSKLKYGRPVGVESLKLTKESISFPVFGIGGIKPDNVREVMDYGADGVAVITGILGAADIKAAAEEYLEGIINETGKE